MLSPPPARYRGRSLLPWIDWQDRPPSAAYSASQATVESRSPNFWSCALLHPPTIRGDRESGPRSVSPVYSRLPVASARANMEGEIEEVPPQKYKGWRRERTSRRFLGANCVETFS